MKESNPHKRPSIGWRDLLTYHYEQRIIQKIVTQRFYYEQLTNRVVVSQDFPSLGSEALRIIDAAEKKGAIIRLMGGVAIRVHTENHSDLYERLRRAPGDLDFMSLKKHSYILQETMEALGYAPNQQLNTYHGHKRQLWYSKQNQIDILFDIFEMCHAIDFRDRLVVDKPTVSPADLFLQKIQIVELNEKDVKDLFILLLEHDLGEDSNDRIDLNYISKLLGEDWGFWYTAILNLQKTYNLLPSYNQLTDNEMNLILKRIKNIMERLNSTPKSLRWKIRERVGTRNRWYNEVEEVIR
jgi:hypothetical protein